MSGTVFKRCTVCGGRAATRRHDARCEARSFTWAFRVDVGTDEDGRRRRRRGGGFDTMRAAERALREVLTKVDGPGGYVEPSELTLADYLTDEWLPYRKPNLRPNSYRNDRNAVRHISREIGTARLKDLNAGHVDRLYATLLDDESGPGLAASTVRKVHTALHRALEDARTWGHLEHNPTERATPPAYAKIKADRRRAVQVWSHPQLLTFLEHVRDDRYWPLWVTAAATGLRRGELAGLVWDAVDLDAGGITVSWSLTPEDGRGPVHKRDLKSSGGARTVDLDRWTAAELRAWRTRQLEERLFAGEQWAKGLNACRQGHPLDQHEAGFVFTWPDGRHLNPDWITHRFADLCAAAGVPAIRPHDVRHTHATLLLKRGHNLKVVQERLGHATAAFTLDTYTHLVPGMQAEAAEDLGRSLLGDHVESDGVQEEGA